MSSELPDLDEAISFAVDNGAQAGPFSMRAIVDSVKQGQRLPSTLVWWAGEPDWVPFNSVPGLVALTQDPVETLPPPPGGDPAFGAADPAGAADATMTFGTAAAADVADGAFAEPVAEAFAAEPVAEMVATEPAADTFEAANVFEPAAAVEETQAVVESGFADAGAPGDVIDIGGEVDATQVWSSSDAVEPEANLVESETSGDFSWATPDPGATADVWSETAAPVESEPESTDTGGLSTGLFGAGAGVVAAAGATASGMFSGADEAVEGAVPDAGDVVESMGDVVPDAAGDLVGTVGDAMPDSMSPLESVNERIEALGADSPVAAHELVVDPGAVTEPVVESAESFVEAVEPAAEAAEPVVDAFESVAEPVGTFEPAVEVAEAQAEAIVDPTPAEAVGADPIDAFEAEAPVEAEVASAVDSVDSVDEVDASFVAVAADASPSTAADSEPEAVLAASADSSLFDELLDRSAMVEASELRADRKIVVLLAGFMNVAADRGLAVLDMVATGLQHSVRFENPADGTRTTVALGNAGEHVRMAFGFGTPVADPESVLTSTAWDDGPIMIGADTDDGLAFTGVDLYVAPSDYVTDANMVDSDALGAMFDALSNELRSSLLFGLDA